MAVLMHCTLVYILLTAAADSLLEPISLAAE